MTLNVPLTPGRVPTVPCLLGLVNGFPSPIVSMAFKQLVFCVVFFHHAPGQASLKGPFSGPSLLQVSALGVKFPRDCLPVSFRLVCGLSFICCKKAVQSVLSSSLG